MRRRWSMGVVVAIAVAVAVVLAGQPEVGDARQSAQPVQVTLALEPDGAVLRIAQGRFVVTFEI